MTERLTRHLSELVGADHVMSHHGSMAKERRLAAEQPLKRGELRALVRTASLCVGLDIRARARAGCALGVVVRVARIGTPRRIATFLQRAGRAGHAVGGLPKARL